MDRKELVGLICLAVSAACFGCGQVSEDDVDGGADGSAADAPPAVIDGASFDGATADATPQGPCILAESFESYPAGAALGGNGAIGEDERCRWATAWEATPSAEWVVDSISAIGSLAGVYGGGEYNIANQRSFDAPPEASEVYVSVRFADLCRLNTPDEALFDGAGDCRSYGKTLQLRLCANADCVIGTIDTVVDTTTLPGQYQLEWAGMTQAFGSIPRPMATDYPEGQYMTIGISATRIALWLNHTLDDGVPTATPDGAFDSPNLNGHSLADFRSVVLTKGAGWAEPGGAAGELRVLAQ